MKNRILISAVAAAALMSAAPPAVAYAGDRNSSVINIGGEGDLLERLIDLDAEGIVQMRADIAEARKDIEEAIVEIEEARREIEAAPAGVRFIVRIAFTAAREASSAAVSQALREARAEIDAAERKLATLEVSASERAETQGAIDGLRLELADLERSLQSMIAALRS